MSGKNVLITGGSDGIGKALVMKLGMLGFNVVTIGRSEEKLTKLQNEFGEISKTKLFTFRGDLTDDRVFEEFINFSRQYLTNIDIIINNAGIQIANSLLEDSDIVAIEKMFKIHTLVPLKLYKEFYPDMKKNNQGIIINIVSVVVKNYLKETYGPYTLTKYAEYGLSNMMVKEASKNNIKVTNVILGGVDSNIRSDPRPEYLAPNDLAEVIGSVITSPEKVFIPEIQISPKVQL